MAKQLHGRQARVKVLDGKKKCWWKFYSVNGTCQHHVHCSENSAHYFAKEKGFIGRFEKSKAPEEKKPAKKRRSKAQGKGV